MSAMIFFTRLAYRLTNVPDALWVPNHNRRRNRPAQPAPAPALPLPLPKLVEPNNVVSLLKELEIAEKKYKDSIEKEKCNKVTNYKILYDLSLKYNVSLLRYLANCRTNTTTPPPPPPPPTPPRALYKITREDRATTTTRPQHTCISELVGPPFFKCEQILVSMLNNKTFRGTSMYIELYTAFGKIYNSKERVSKKVKTTTKENELFLDNCLYEFRDIQVQFGFCDAISQTLNGIANTVRQTNDIEYYHVKDIYNPNIHDTHHHHQWYHTRIYDT
jgi:hypothetical protein